MTIEVMEVRRGTGGATLRCRKAVAERSECRLQPVTPHERSIQTQLPGDVTEQRELRCGHPGFADPLRRRRSPSANTSAVVEPAIDVQVMLDAGQHGLELRGFGSLTPRRRVALTRRSAIRHRSGSIAPMPASGCPRSRTARLRWKRKFTRYDSRRFQPTIPDPASTSGLGFPSTRHSMIERMRAGGSTVRRQAFGDLVEGILESYLHASSPDLAAGPEDAKDATQGFFADAFAKRGSSNSRRIGALPDLPASLCRSVRAASARGRGAG